MDSHGLPMIPRCHTELWHKILDENDEILLQQDLDRLTEWTKNWCLQLNVDKCKVMRITHTGQHEYKIDGNKI